MATKPSARLARKALPLQDPTLGIADCRHLRCVAWSALLRGTEEGTSYIEPGCSTRMQAKGLSWAANLCGHDECGEDQDLRGAQADQDEDDAVEDHWVGRVPQAHHPVGDVPGHQRVHRHKRKVWPPSM